MASGLQRELEAIRTNFPAKELSVGGTEWRYRVTADTGPALLMLHGGGGSADSLFRYVARLSPRLQLLVPSVPTSVATVAEALAGIRAIISHAGIQPSNYLGFSMGGMLEQVMLRQAPQGIRSMTLFHCPLPSPSFADVLERRSILMRMPLPLLTPVVRWQMRRELAGSELGEDELAFWADFYSSPEVLHRTSGHQRIVLDYLRNYSFTPGQLEGWGGQVQIFETATDKLISESERERLKKLYPDAAVTTFESGGHVGNGVTKWQEVADRVAAICQPPPGSRASAVGR